MKRDVERLLRRCVINEAGCWLWQGWRKADGYGLCWAQGKNRSVHRFMYEALVGPIPAGLTLDHLCHGRDPSCAGGADCAHRACVNPDHLEPCGRHENVMRGNNPVALARLRGTCPSGHPYSHTDSNGWLKCIECQRKASREYQRRRAAGAKR